MTTRVGEMTDERLREISLLIWDRLNTEQSLWDFIADQTLQDAKKQLIVEIEQALRSVWNEAIEAAAKLCFQTIPVPKETTNESIILLGQEVFRIEKEIRSLKKGERENTPSGR